MLGIASAIRRVRTMPTLVVLLLVVAIHLATNVTAWGSVGLLADDRFNIGFQVLVEKLPFLEQLRLIFLPDNLAVDQTAALYRPFISLTFLWEYPWFGTEALGSAHTAAPAGAQFVRSQSPCAQ